MYLTGMSLVIIVCENLHVYIVCIRHCEHACFCEEVFMCHIKKKHSFIYQSRNAFDRVIICLDICSQWESAVMKSVRKCTERNKVCHPVWQHFLKATISICLLCLYLIWLLVIIHENTWFGCKESSGTGNNYKIVNVVFFVTCKQSPLNIHCNFFCFRDQNVNMLYVKGVVVRKHQVKFWTVKVNICYTSPIEPI